MRSPPSHNAKNGLASFGIWFFETELDSPSRLRLPRKTIKRKRHLKSALSSYLDASQKEGFPMTKAILVVDDDPDIRLAVCELFKREAGCEVCGEAFDGRDGIEKAQRLDPDLIILDLSMPVMNGLEAAHLLKDLMPSTPIILFTVCVDSFVKEEARSAGIDDVVSKAEHLSVLTARVRDLLSREAA